MVCVPQPEQQRLGMAGGGDEAPVQSQVSATEDEAQIVQCSVYDMTKRSHSTSMSSVFVRSNKTVAELYSQLADIYGHAVDSFEVTLQCIGGTKDCVVLGRDSWGHLLRDVGFNFDSNARNSLILADVKAPRSPRGRKCALSSPTSDVTVTLKSECKATAKTSSPVTVKTNSPATVKKEHHIKINMENSDTTDSRVTAKTSDSKATAKTSDSPVKNSLESDSPSTASDSPVKNEPPATVTSENEATVNSVAQEETSSIPDPPPAPPEFFSNGSLKSLMGGRGFLCVPTPEPSESKEFQIDTPATTRTAARLRAHLAFDESNKADQSPGQSLASPGPSLDLFATSSLINKTETSYVGLVNQAMTCYLNSLLQALYMTPEFRNALYKWEFDGKEGDTGAKSIPFQLQKLFLNLQTSQKNAVETTELTRSFGWDSSEAWQQHDVQELCRVMFDALEHKFRRTDQADLINNLYEGKMIDYVKCLECGTEKQREDKFLDIPLPVRPFGSTVAYGSVVEALRAFVQPETLDGANQYHCEKCEKKCNAHKGLKFTKFPYLLTLHLKRFDFDYSTLHRIKLNDKVVFPELLELNSFISSENSNNHVGNHVANHTEEPTAVKYDDSSTTDSGSALDDDNQPPDPSPSTSARCNSAQVSQPDVLQEDDEGIDVLNHWSSWDSGTTLENNEKNARRSLEKGPYSYELFAIMIHSGSASGGHYYAYIKDFSSGQWFCFNDQSVSRITSDDIRKTFGGGVSRAYYSGTYSSSTNAYMLMYRQIDKQRNCEAMKQDQFPPHIKNLLENMHDQEEKEKSEREKQMEVCRIKVYSHNPSTHQLINCKIYCTSDVTLTEATQKAHKQLGMEGLVPLEWTRLVAYDQLQDSIEGSFEGREEDPICDIVNGSGKGKLDLMLELKKNDDPWVPQKPGTVMAKVFVVDLSTEEVEGPHLLQANLSQTIPEFREVVWKALPEHFGAVKAQSLVVALERYGGQARVLDDEARTLKSENFYATNKVFVALYMDDDPDKCFPNSKMYRLIDRFENTITLHMSLPDTDQEILDELGIPTLAQLQQQQQCPVVQRTQDDAEDVLSTSSCSLPEASAGADTSTLLQPSSPPLARPQSSLQLLPPAPPDASWSAPEDETTGGASTGDQSASEDSSLTDSERTLVGDQENLLAQLSTPCSDDSPQQGEAQHTTTSTPEDAPPDTTHTYKSFKEDLDWEEDDEAGGSSSGAGHKRLISANFFRATPYEEENAHMLKVELDKRTSLPALKKQLEPFVGVPMDYFKIFRSYSSSDEFEFTSYNATYRDGESLSIRLGRALRKGEFRGKVFQLCPGATESTKFLFDWILARGSLVADAKKQILDELKKKHSIDIPFDRCRLRKKSWKNPGQVYYDNQRFEDSMCIVANWELFVQELPEAPAPRPPNASLPELVLFVRRWSPSTLTLGPFQEVELASTAGEELRTKLAELSGIAAENIEIAKGQGSFPCDISVLAVNTDLEWNPPTNSLNSWPLNIFEDGHVILYRDSMESVKLLTAEERKEMERAENSRVSRLGGASISTYSPRKERALKIYLDATPPKSRDDDEELIYYDDIFTEPQYPKCALKRSFSIAFTEPEW